MWTRDSGGIYIGNPSCRNYDSVVEVKERICCDNKILRFAQIRCAAKGIVEAEMECLVPCTHFEEDFVKARR